MIRNKVVSNGCSLKVPAHLSLGQHYLEIIRDNIERYGDAVAMINGNTGEEMYHTQILQDAVNIAVGLNQLGVKRGQVVAFYSESRSDIIPGVIGATFCGATVTMFNVLYTKYELEHVLKISKPSVIICSTTALEANIDVLKGTKSIKRIVQLCGDPMEDGVLTLKEVMRECDPNNYEPEEVNGTTDTAMIFYSSGTTGLPKGVMLTHLNILFAYSSFNGYTLEVSRRILSVLPWYHVLGFITTTVYVLSYKKLIYLTGFNHEKYLQAIQKYQANTLMLVPPIIVFLAKSALVEEYDVTSVQVMWCGAAPLGQDIADATAKRFPNFTKLIQGYGLTESTLAVLKYIDELEASPGYLPVAGCYIKVVDIATGDKLGPNENGEICVKSPSLMIGYVDDEDATRASFDEQGFLKTGDVGFYDENGYFSIIDRLKEIIKYKGNQVSPAQVENVILQLSGVADCAVVGRPDEVAGELPTAFVVNKPGARLTEHDVLEFTSSKLSPFSRLRGGVIFIDMIPKSAAGKILRRVLKEKYMHNV